MPPLVEISSHSAGTRRAHAGGSLDPIGRYGMKRIVILAVLLTTWGTNAEEGPVVDIKIPPPPSSPPPAASKGAPEVKIELPPPPPPPYPITDCNVAKFYYNRKGISKAEMERVCGKQRRKQHKQ